METFIQPLNESIEDWKKSANTLDKDHAKGLKGILRNDLTVFFLNMINFSFPDYKKLRNELRKKASETVKLQKKCRKCKFREFIHQ